MASRRGPGGGVGGTVGNWEDLLGEMRGGPAGRLGPPATATALGGGTAPNIDPWGGSANIGPHKGLGLQNDLRNESSIVGNFPQVVDHDGRFRHRRQRSVWSEA